MAEDKKKFFPWNKADKDDDAMMEEVYAGPEFFEQRDKEASMMEGVYAGPEYFNRAPMPEGMPEREIIGMVYAGPEYFNNQQPSGGMGMMFTPMNQMPTSTQQTASPFPKPQEDTFKTCPSCGAKGFYGKFCPECGMPCPVEDKTE